MIGMIYIVDHRPRNSNHGRSKAGENLCLPIQCLERVPVFFLSYAMLQSSILVVLAVPAAFGLYWEDGTGRLPAMGWNSWNAYHCDVDAGKIMEAANAMVDQGFQKAGYNYVNCDDCWSMKDGRDNATHQLRVNTTKFPDGMDGLVSKLHGMGFKTGIYSSAGYLTCGGYPASLGYEAIDAETFANWGIGKLEGHSLSAPETFDRIVRHRLTYPFKSDCKLQGYDRSATQADMVPSGRADLKYDKGVLPVATF